MPTLDNRPFNYPDNFDILDAIKKNATLDYQRRIPDATKGNIDATVNALINNRPSMNEFIDSLVNRIGMVVARSNIWTNPLAKFKVGMLEYGDTIEEIMNGLLKAKRYDPDRDYLEKDIFGVERPEVQASYHKVNRQDYYKVTVNEPLLMRAFISNDGLSKFIANLMSTPTTSDNWDEFLLTASLFKTYYEADGFFKVNIPDISDVDSDANDAKAALRSMRSMAEKLKYLSTHYNASGLPVVAQADELELFITPEAQAAIDVEALAGAFNINKAEFASRTTVIPQEYFGIDGAQAILTTRDFFVIADQRIDTTSAINPVGLHTNYFLHHWEVVSASRFVPAILFTTEEGDVINISDTPTTDIVDAGIYDTDGNVVTTVERGGVYSVVGVGNGSETGIYFTLSGVESPRTYITPTGNLHVAEDEASESVTINEVSVEDSSVTHTITATITGDLLTLWPNPGVVSDADNDGLLEVTPEAPAFADNVITIPAVPHVQYKNGATNLNNGQQITVVDGTPVTITAVGRTGWEITAGATASWTFTYSA